MVTKSEIQKYIDEHIKSIVVERHGNKFYGTLTDKEGRTFEFSKYVLDVQRQFSNTHSTVHNNADIKEAMLLKYFQRLFVRMYASRQQLVDLGILETM